MSRIDTICVCVYVCDCTVSMWPDQLRPRQTSETIYIMIHVCTTTIKILDSLNGVGFFFQGGGVSLSSLHVVYMVFSSMSLCSLQALHVQHKLNKTPVWARKGSKLCSWPAVNWVGEWTSTTREFHPTDTPCLSIRRDQVGLSIVASPGPSGRVTTR